MKLRGHPRKQNNNLVLGNGASYSVQWVIAGVNIGLETDTITSGIWKPYKKVQRTPLTKRNAFFQKRFGSLGGF